MDQVLNLTPLERAQALGPGVAAAADEIQTTQRIPEPLLSDLHGARLFRLLAPRSVGGDEAHPVAYLEAVMEISRHDGAVGWNMFVANSSALIAPFLPLASAKLIYDDPAAVIAWGPPNACKIDAADGGYRVSGEWGFASGCRQATWMGAHGPVVEPDGSLRLNERGAPLIRTVLFPADQATLLGDWNPFGLIGTASESYRVEDVFVPEAFSSTREQPELRRDSGPLYAFTMQGLYAVGVAGVALGLADAMLGAFKALAVEKTPRGRPKLGDDALVQADVARWDAALGAGVAYLEKVLNDVYERADDRAPIGVEDRARVRLACTHGIHAAVDVADRIHKAAGVSAIFPGSPFERRFRDIHTLSQQIQARDSHYEAVGQVLLGAPPAVFF